MKAEYLEKLPIEGKIIDNTKILYVIKSLPKVNGEINCISISSSKINIISGLIRRTFKI